MIQWKKWWRRGCFLYDINECCWPGGRQLNGSTARSVKAVAVLVNGVKSCCFEDCSSNCHAPMLVRRWRTLKVVLGGRSVHSQGGKDLSSAASLLSGDISRAQFPHNMSSSQDQEIASLKKQLEALKNENLLLKQQQNFPSATTSSSPLYSNPISPQDTARFSRHLILPDISVHGQHKLLNSKVLIVGCGGLGSPLCEYLTAMGLGTIGLMDFDVVDQSNLHRQVIHDETTEGMPKVFSAMARMKKLRSSVNVRVHQQAFDESVLPIVQEYDIVVDASDNVRTRYLVNDACVLAKKPLVSGSAVRVEGQLTVYNYNNGPCYRCMFPSPPPPETVTNCSDGGVLGVVPGIIGSLQALEVVKLLLGGPFASGILSQKMLIFNSKLGTMFRTVRLRGRQKNCAVCGDNPTIQSLVGYDNVSCSSNLPPISSDNRISVEEYAKKWKEEPHVLLDVRNSTQFNICNLPDSWNVPYAQLKDHIEQVKERSQKGELPIYVVCRRGNDSVRATHLLVQEGFKEVYNIDGGVSEWQRSVDSEFPLY